MTALKFMGSPANSHPSKWPPASRRDLEGNFPRPAQGLVHPITRRTFHHAAKAHPLNFKFLADERIQIFTLGDDIAAITFGRFAGKFKFLAKRVMDFHRKKSDLAFVILFKLIEPVAPDAAPGHAFNCGNFNDRIVPGRLAVMSEIIVTG